MKRRFPIYVIMALVATTLVCSCNNDDDELSKLLPDSAVDAVMVNTFSLVADDSVLANLDSVFFSIDLERAVIFNADSLPKGTKVNRLVTTMTFSSVKKAEITMPGSTGADTVVNYLSNPTDSIDFSRGSVKLHLESASGEVSRDYTIYVNVHKVDPDRMEWQKMKWSLPTNLASVTEERTVQGPNDMVLCFTTDGTNYCMAQTQNPDMGWTMSSVAMPDGAKLSSLVSGGDKLYVIDADNNLYVSEDMGANWTGTGVKMSHIYGATSDLAVGAIPNGSTFESVTYPSSGSVVLDADMPVAATSPAIIYTTEWSDSPMMIVAGGLDAAGNPVAGIWAFDGGEWARISNKLPALEAPVMIPYYAFRTSAEWKVTRRSVLLCFGGRTTGGAANRAIYVSNDMGVNWAEASTSVALPVGYTPGAYAQAVIVNQTLGSRAVKPITEWDCPYIYMFGGDALGSSVTTDIWRGVLNRLEFKPLQ